MTRRRWIADEFSNDRATLTGEHAEHSTRVLRAAVGQEFDIAAGAVVRRGRVTKIEEGRVEFALGEEVSIARLADLALVLAIFKFDRMEWAIEKCTELGVARIIPLIARRTDTHLASAATKRVERWRRLALQASEQSRRIAPPQITDSMKLQEAAALSPQARRIILAEAEHEIMLRDVLPEAEKEIVLAIGPEGGWADEELQLFQKAGWISASLGPTILRAETAAIAATAIAVSELG